MAACLLHVQPPLAARGFRRRRKKVRQAGGFGTVSSSLLFPARGGRLAAIVTCRRRKKRKTFGFNFLSFLDLLSVFPCFKFVSSADLFLFFLFHLLLCFRWQQDQGGCRLLGSGFPSGLCSCRWPVRVLAKTRACGLLPLGWRGRSKSG